MKIALLGARGRLGSLISQVASERNHEILALTRRSFEASACVATAQQLSACDVLIDVSLPQGTAQLSDLLLKTEVSTLEKLKCLIVGTTGHTEKELRLLHSVAQNFPVVVASNFSKGVFLFHELLAAKTRSGLSVSELAKDLGFDLAMVESHHTQKKDAPSGTALTLAQAADVAPSNISSLRVGQVTGEHSLYLSADSEELRFTHVAHNRRLFAIGAVDLAERAAAKQLPKKVMSVGEVLSGVVTT